jgi:hypothetical protein
MAVGWNNFLGADDYFFHVPVKLMWDHVVELA